MVPPRHSLACLSTLLCIWEKVRVGTHQQISKQVKAIKMDTWCWGKAARGVALPRH